MRLDHQAAPYVENVTWNAAGVQFGTLDRPGSSNDWLPWFGTTPQSQAQVDEFTGRNAADLAWLDHIFDAARRSHAAAVVLGIQADMWDPNFSGATDDPTQYDHFTDFVQALAKEARAFHKPVLLLNGDSHQFADDHPLADAGKAYKLTIDPEADAVFSYQRIRFSQQPGFPASCAV